MGFIVLLNKDLVMLPVYFIDMHLCRIIILFPYVFSQAEHEMVLG